MINRHIGRSIPCLAATQKVFTCSTGDVLSGAAINGRVIDRLGLGARYQFRAANPFLHVTTTVGSTAPDQKIALDIKIQHGDSSGGGDMADFTTGLQPATRTFLSTFMSTVMQNWSTGQQFFDHNGEYEITAAKRYIRAVGTVTRGGVTTSTAAGSIDFAYADMGINFKEADNAPFTDTTSTATSSST
jgi:hypothetical protein